MGYSKVRSYRKQDGTIVREHQRRNLLTRMFSFHKRDSHNLEALAGAAPVYPRQRDLDEVQVDVASGGYGFAGKDVPQKALSAAAAGVAAGVYAGVVGAMFPVGTAIIAAGLAPLLIQKVPEFLSVRKAKKDMEQRCAAPDPGAPNEEQLKAFLETTGWKTNAFSASYKDDSSAYDYSVSENGLGVIKGENWFWTAGQKFVVPRQLYFYPGADFSKTDFLYPVRLPGVNLAGANFKDTVMSIANLEGANLDGTDWTDAKMTGRSWEIDVKDPLSFKNASLRNANLTGAQFQLADMSGCDLTGATLKGAMLPSDLTNIDISRSQFEQLTDGTLSYKSPGTYKYKKHTFDEAVKELNLDEQRFEYLVLSKVIQVRDNDTNEIVTSNFDPDLHHVPAWEMAEAKKSFANLNP